MAADKIEKVINLCARRGILFPNAEPYVALAGFFDYGHYGALMKRRLENAWWREFVESREDVVGLDAACVNPSSVWRASGHLDAFNDPLVDCKKCGKRFRADHLIEDELGLSVDGVSLQRVEELMREHKLVCPKCKGELSGVKAFNLMLKTHVGAVEDESSAAFLRPETAQTIFVDFKKLAATTRKPLPFGVAQVGRAFRNEISPRNFVFRCREFTMAEIEFFVHPQRMDDCPLLSKELLDLKVQALTAEDQEAQEDKEKKQGARKTSFRELVDKKTIGTRWLAYWIARPLEWLISLGLNPARLRIRQHVREELSHYSRETWDVEYDYPEWGWKELMGIADRGDFDLKQHEKHSKKEFAFFDEETKQKVLPHVIEPSLGIDRLLFTLLADAYNEKTEKEETKTILSLAPRVAPVQCAIFPLMKKDGLAERARSIFETLRKEFVCEYDESGSIGKRYARADEVGTPLAATIDYQTLEDGTVTLRDRDSAKQERVKASELAARLRLVTTR